MSAVSWKDTKEALEEYAALQEFCENLQGVGDVALASLEGVIYIFSFAQWQSMGASSALHFNRGYKILFPQEAEEAAEEMFRSALTEIFLSYACAYE